ncbi:MAG: LapA family protein [Nitrospinae bacterium]|nr:LapA family protein [Nitrospinota bacterium]
MAVKLVLGLMVIFLFVLFAAQNQQSVGVTFFFGYQYTAPMWLMAALCFGLGAAISVVAGAVAIISEKSRNFRLSRRVAKLEEELSGLKSRPISDDPALYMGGGKPSRPANSSFDNRY